VSPASGPGTAELAVAADRARGLGDGAAGRLRLDALRGVLDAWRAVEPRLAAVDPARARDLQERQDEVRELLIDADRWPVGDAVATLMAALAPLMDAPGLDQPPDSLAEGSL